MLPVTASNCQNNDAYIRCTVVRYCYSYACNIGNVGSPASSGTFYRTLTPSAECHWNKLRSVDNTKNIVSRGNVP